MEQKETINKNNEYLLDFEEAQDDIYTGKTADFIAANKHLIKKIILKNVYIETQVYLNSFEKIFGALDDDSIEICIEGDELYIDAAQEDYTNPKHGTINEKTTKILFKALEKSTITKISFCNIDISFEASRQLKQALLLNTTVKNISYLGLGSKKEEKSIFHLAPDILEVCKKKRNIERCTLGTIEDSNYFKELARIVEKNKQYNKNKRLAKEAKNGNDICSLMKLYNCFFKFNPDDEFNFYLSEAIAGLELANFDTFYNPFKEKLTLICLLLTGNQLPFYRDLKQKYFTDFCDLFIPKNEQEILSKAQIFSIVSLKTMAEGNKSFQYDMNIVFIEQLLLREEIGNKEIQVYYLSGGSSQEINNLVSRLFEFYRDVVEAKIDILLSMLKYQIACHTMQSVVTQEKIRMGTAPPAKRQKITPIFNPLFPPPRPEVMATTQVLGPNNPFPSHHNN